MARPWTSKHSLVGQRCELSSTDYTEMNQNPKPGQLGDGKCLLIRLVNAL